MNCRVRVKAHYNLQGRRGGGGGGGTGRRTYFRRRSKSIFSFPAGAPICADNGIDGNRIPAGTTERMNAPENCPVIRGAARPCTP